MCKPPRWIKRELILIAAFPFSFTKRLWFYLLVTTWYSRCTTGRPRRIKIVAGLIVSLERTHVLSLYDATWCMSECRRLGGTVSHQVVDVVLVAIQKELAEIANLCRANVRSISHTHTHIHKLVVKDSVLPCKYLRVWQPKFFSEIEILGLTVYPSSLNANP